MDTGECGESSTRSISLSYRNDPAFLLQIIHFRGYFNTTHMRHGIPHTGMGFLTQEWDSSHGNGIPHTGNGIPHTGKAEMEFGKRMDTRTEFFLVTVNPQLCRKLLHHIKELQEQGVGVIKPSQIFQEL